MWNATEEQDVRQRHPEKPVQVSFDWRESLGITAEENLEHLESAGVIVLCGDRL